MKEHHPIGEERISHNRRRENITQQRKKELHKRDHTGHPAPHYTRRERGHHTTTEGKREGEGGIYHTIGKEIS